jgi:hypothetical protein
MDLTDSSLQFLPFSLLIELRCILRAFPIFAFFRPHI